MPWKSIPGYPGYSANEKGEIRNEKTQHVTKGGDAGHYLKVSVYAKGESKPTLCYVHDLVCRAFHGAPKKNQVVLHKDDNKKNCRPSNLKWGTQSENIKSAHDNGLISKESRAISTLTATVIKGNPKFVDGNPLAEKYYHNIVEHLKSLGVVNVHVDPGKDYTRPPESDIYIAHSRGVGRLDFLKNPKSSISVKLGVLDGVIAPDDAAWQKVTKPGTGTPPDSHFDYFDKQKQAVEHAVKMAMEGLSFESAQPSFIHVW